MTSPTPDVPGDDWRRPRPDRRALKSDAVVAALLAAGTTVSCLLYARAGIYPEDMAPVWMWVAYVVVMNAPLALRRRFPLTVVLVLAVGFYLSQALRVPELLFSNICLFLAFYSAGAWSNRRRLSRLTRAAIIAGMFAWLFIALITEAPEALLSADGLISPYASFGLVQIVMNVLYFGAAYVFGERAWNTARDRSALELRTAELAAERERTAAQAVALERVRIARELHDVVAHHVSVMGVQAGAARRLLATDPTRAAESLTAIEGSAREAVDELHRMLTTLREEDEDASAPEDGAPRAPSTRGVDQLGELVRDAEAAGVPVRFTVVGEPRPVPGTIGVTVFRIAQEAITNTLKHAGPGAEVDMRLRFLPDSVEIEVVDDGSGLRTRPKGSGLGHIGMRERVAAVGGALEIGPRSRGGFLVRARLPLGAHS